MQNSSSIDSYLENGESIFQIISDLALKNHASDLGKGYPNFDCDEEIKSFLQDAIHGDNHQYTSAYGHPGLRKKVSEIYNKNYGVEFNFQNEITITCGAQEALSTSITSFLNSGDEVIIFNPFFCFYTDIVESVEAIPVFVDLVGEKFKFSKKVLDNSISHKTRMIILNNPHNPSGKVYTIEELNIISEIAIKYDLIVISDEVYEYYNYDETHHFPICKLNNMKDRTVTISSVGKTFGITGWKIGWICCTENLTTKIRERRSKLQGSLCTPIQVACIKILDLLLTNHFIEDLNQKYVKKRDWIIDELQKLEFKVFKGNSTIFVIFEIPSTYRLDDKHFCLDLVQNYQLALIPMSYFYKKGASENKLIRLCFAKDEITLNNAIKNLKRWRVDQELRDEKLKKLSGRKPDILKKNTFDNKVNSI